MWAVLVLIFPYYKFYVDPDATAYLTISARYAVGDISRAVNGLWGPWACWLTAILIKGGLAAIPAAIFVNALGGAGFHFVSHSLFLRFHIDRRTQWLLNAVFATFIVFATFWQTFDDLWQCFFLTAVLRILLITDFTVKPRLWVLAGSVGAFSYFAKAYSIPFFALSTTACVYVLTKGHLKQTFKVMVVSGGVMLLCSFPWMAALYSKYGIWTTSTAGGLNMSWYLVGHPEWKDSIDILLPPVYPNSTYYWEDPYVVNGHLSHFWDSWYLAFRLVLRIGYNVLSFVVCLLELSVFFPVVWVYVLGRLLLQKKYGSLMPNEKIIYLTFLLLPAGYIMVHLESRYLWYMVPIGMIAGVHLIEGRYKSNEQQVRFLVILWALSFVVFPVLSLKKLYNEGEREYRFAQKLISAGLTEVSFVSNLHPRLLSKIAFFSRNSFYVINKQKVDTGVVDLSKMKLENTDVLEKELVRYRVGYYLHADKTSGKLMNPGFYDLFYENLRDSTDVINLPVVLEDAESGIKVFRVIRDSLEINASQPAP
ncbi:MAG: hypothetical protein IAE95_12620 [Chitinophagaceae bacterium]|nr:hypothetical protein [Chitinophagaceae bacterium]